MGFNVILANILQLDQLYLFRGVFVDILTIFLDAHFSDQTLKMKEEAWLALFALIHP